MYIDFKPQFPLRSMDGFRSNCLAVRLKNYFNNIRVYSRQRLFEDIECK